MGAAFDLDDVSWVQAREISAKEKEEREWQQSLYFTKQRLAADQGKWRTYAAAALQGLLATGGADVPDDQWTLGLAAELAAEAADEMLELERERF